MNAELSILSRFRYTRNEWLYAKVLTIILWLYPVINILFKFNAQPMPVGICHWFNCAVVTLAPVSYILSALAIALTVLYLLEMRMLIVTFLMSLLAVLVFSIEASNGLHGRKEGVSMLLIVQFLAYLRYSIADKNFKEATTAHDIAMFYCVQIVAVIFVLAAISKLEVSGIAWVTDSPTIAVRLLRALCMRTIDTGYPVFEQYGRFMVQRIIANPLIVQIGFGMVLVAELFSFCAIFSRRWAWRYGILLVLINIGFIILLGIVISFYFLPILAFLVNFGPGEKSKEPSATAINFSLKSFVLMFTIPLVYAVLTFMIGEQHPFSKVPLFTSSSNRTAYYYLKDQNGKFLHGSEKAIYRTGEIKDIIHEKSSVHHVGLDDAVGIKTIAPEVLAQLLEAKGTADKLKDVTRLQLYMHEIKLVNGKILEQDILLGETSPKPISK
jgi:hypothetical protein